MDSNMMVNTLSGGVPLSPGPDDSFQRLNTDLPPQPIYGDDNLTAKEMVGEQTSGDI